METAGFTPDDREFLDNIDTALSKEMRENVYAEEWNAAYVNALTSNNKLAIDEVIHRAIKYLESPELPNWRRKVITDFLDKVAPKQEQGE